MLTHTFLDTAGTRQRLFARRRCLILLLVPLTAFPTFADEKTVANDAPAQLAPDVTTLPPEIEARASAYQACVNSVMSTLEPATVKRQQIPERCGVARGEMVNAFPVQLRPLIEVHTDRRIASVLDGLERIETAVMESAEDVNEIADDLAALNEE